jgi:hypothetical protein
LAMIRRRIFTGAAVVSLLVCLATVGLWVRSYGRADYIERGTRDSYVFIETSEGSVILGGVEGAGTPCGWGLGTLYTDDRRFERVQRPDPVVLWNSAAFDSSRNWITSARLWTAVIAFFVLPAYWVGVLRFADKRGRRTGLCRTCGYSLTGNASGVCPECGTAVEGKA